MDDNEADDETARALDRVGKIGRSNVLGAAPSAAVLRVVKACESALRTVERVRDLVSEADRRDADGSPFTYAGLRDQLDRALRPQPVLETADALIALADDITPDRTLSVREWKLLRTAASLLTEADRSDS